METQEEEFECSNCGATVSAEAKICPNCGASLEETSEEESPKEEEFVEIPITSDPAILSAIISLLDEKKIKYSINENPMENIWGPSFLQVPKLLVGAEKEDEIKEIIKSIEEGEIKVLDDNVVEAEPSEKDKEKESIKGVEGWLLVLSLLLILGPITYIPYYIFDFLESHNYLSNYSLTYTIVVMDLGIGIYLSFLSIKAGLKLYTVKSDAIVNANIYFNIFIIYQVIGFLVVGFGLYNLKLNSNTIIFFDLLISETISSILFAIIAKLYLKNSERVKNTYGTSFVVKTE